MLGGGEHNFRGGWTCVSGESGGHGLTQDVCLCACVSKRPCVHPCVRAYGAWRHTGCVPTCLRVHASLCASVCACIRGMVSHRHTRVLVRKKISILGGGERAGEGVPGALEIGQGVVGSGVMFSPTTTTAPRAWSRVPEGTLGVEHCLGTFILTRTLETGHRAH